MPLSDKTILDSHCFVHELKRNDVVLEFKLPETSIAECSLAECGNVCVNSNHDAWCSRYLKDVHALELRRSIKLCLLVLIDSRDVKIIGFFTSKALNHILFSVGQFCDADLGDTLGLFSTDPKDETPEVLKRLSHDVSTQSSSSVISVRIEEAREFLKQDTSMPISKKRH
ncbi:hypothetical protein Tco_0088882 [Tanacetum coccineum]